ncbi:MAG: two-component system, sensor histidine kinase and response regulator [Micromonosporaceae bacterium]|nr:two-component system, sensor histidine kinase and response regulator [Micromonosporaceae bacterium]
MPQQANPVPPETQRRAPPAHVDGPDRRRTDTVVAAAGSDHTPMTLSDALARLADAEDTLRAIGAGEIDAVVVSDGGTGHRVSTLSTADRTYRLFVENMHDGAATLSPSGVLLYANRRLAKLLGCTRDTIVGSPFALFVAGDSALESERLRNPGSLGTAFEMYLLDSRGKSVPVLVGVSPLEVNGDRLTCLTFTDLSARKAQDREITRLGQAQVERLVDLQTAQAALTSASERGRDEALARSDVMSQFLATMSHEIRTPMNGVIGLASLLLGTHLDPRQTRYTAGIHAAGTALLEVINDILDFSKIEADKLVLDLADFNPFAVLTEVATLIDPTAQRKGLTMVTHGDPELPTTVHGDGGRWRQILLNLVGNAVKFTPSGSVTLRVSRDTSAAADTEIRIRLDVSDTGIGIAATDAERLFEPFTQADVSTTRVYGGTGLGLAICRRLTEAMGGTIGVNSAPGQGSTFWCLIPFGAARQTTSDATTPPTTDTTKMRVLVVSGQTRTPLQESLRGWMMTSSGVNSAADAVAALRHAAARGRPFDVTVIDTDLAGVDAIDLIHQITTDPDIRDAHIIILNHHSPADSPAAIDGVSYLTKPVHQSDLYNCLTKTIPRSPPEEVMAARRANRVMAEPPATEVQRRILLVEDNDINQMVAVGILTGLGYHLTVANDGIEAVDLATADTYDAILMDWRMPRMDGVTATSQIRRHEGGGRRTPIIAMTASALTTDREACLAADMDDYLTKPVNPAELEATLNRWITGAGPRTAPQTTSGAAPAPALTTADDDQVARRLTELRGGNTEPERIMVNRLIVSFLDRAPRYLATLSAAVAAADTAAVAEHAHAFNGAVGNLGAADAAHRCQRLEALGRTGHLDQTAADDLQQLRTEINAVDLQLRANLQQHRQPPPAGGPPPPGSGAPVPAAVADPV